MTEPEVSLGIAEYFLDHNLANGEVSVSLDGAHVKTKTTVHFDIEGYFQKKGYKKISSDDGKWQGTYTYNSNPYDIRITSQSGIGDIVIPLKNGAVLYVESKKFDKSKGHALMREAIGQLMTNGPMLDHYIYAVAAPYNDQTKSLVLRWKKYHQILTVGIQFILLKEDRTVFTTIENIGID